MNLKIWINFKQIKELAEEGEYNLSDFNYSFITDKQIKRWIGKVKVDILKEKWEDKKVEYLFNSKSFKSFQMKMINLHAQRIAALVKLIEDGEKIEPVIFEISNYCNDRNFVVDGNHRIRAYQFLNKDGFWGEMGGEWDLMKKFKKSLKEV
jgi:hypothetical protein